MYSNCLLLKQLLDVGSQHLINSVVIVFVRHFLHRGEQLGRNQLFQLYFVIHFVHLGNHMDAFLLNKLAISLLGGKQEL